MKAGSRSPGRVPHRMPVLPEVLVRDAPGFRLAMSATTASLELDAPIVIEGVSGVGKTTAVTALAAQSGLLFSRMQMKKKADGFDVLASLYECLTGETRSRGRVSRPEMSETVQEILLEGGRGLIVDDVHHMSVDGIQEIRWYFDQVGLARGCDGEGFPLWLVGTHVLPAVALSEELTSRVVAWTTIKPLTLAQLLAVLAKLDPRLAVTDDELVSRLDGVARGRLREWRDIIRLTRRRWPDATGPLTEKEVVALLAYKPGVLPGRDAR